MGEMTSLLWERRMDVVLCLLIQTSLIAAFHCIQTLGAANANTSMPGELSRLEAPKV